MANFRVASVLYLLDLVGYGVYELRQNIKNYNFTLTQPDLYILC